MVSAFWGAFFKKLNQFDGGTYPDFDTFGVIASGERDVRVAFSCLEAHEVPAVYVLVHEDDPTTMKRRIKSAQMNH